MLSDDPNMDSLKLISLGLYKSGKLRYVAEKTSTNVYRQFRDPTVSSMEPDIQFGQNQPKAVEEAVTKNLLDFEEIHQVTVNFGSPEVADQMSGNIYMHATVTEDECSKCMRLTDTLADFSINDIKAAVTCLGWWGSDVQYSMALRDLVEALDRATVDRLNSLHFSLEDQLRLAFQWRSLLFQPQVEFPTKMLHSASPFVLQSSLPVLISFLLLLSAEPSTFFSPSSPSTFPLPLVSGKEVSTKLIPAVDFLGESEVAAACLGLRRLQGGEEGAAVLASILAHKWGYNM